MLQSFAVSTTSAHDMVVTAIHASILTSIDALPRYATKIAAAAAPCAARIEAFLLILLIANKLLFIVMSVISLIIVT